MKMHGHAPLYRPEIREHGQPICVQQYRPPSARELAVAACSDDAQTVYWCLDLVETGMTVIQLQRMHPGSIRVLLALLAELEQAQLVTRNDRIRGANGRPVSVWRIRPEQEAPMR
jgi:hypothetical protein